VFPRAIEPQLPSADRIARQIRDNLGDEALVSLALCVAPDGHVTKVAMLDGSAYGPFDAAVLDDAKAWQFAAMPGPDNLQTCERVKVRYIAPR
jgi:TonB family protein